MAHAPAPPVALPLRVVAKELGVQVDDSDDGSDLDMDVGSSPLAARARGDLGGWWLGPRVLG